MIQCLTVLTVLVGLRVGISEVPPFGCAMSGAASVVAPAMKIKN
jgi:hypothetical protein